MTNDVPFEDKTLLGELQKRVSDIEERLESVEDIGDRLESLELHEHSPSMVDPVHRQSCR
jgi:hypothetical protein